MNERLFTDFEVQSPEAWKDKLVSDLKGKPFEDLLWENQGLSGKPFYTKEDLPSTLPPLGKIHANPEAFGNRYWANYQHVIVNSTKEANERALLALESGADGLLFELQKLTDLTILLQGIQVQYCQVSFLSNNLSTEDIFTAYANYLSAANIDKEKVNGFIDGIGYQFQKEIKGLKTVVLKTNKKTNHSAQQIALILAEIIDLIDVENIAPIDFFNMLSTEITLSSDYFSEIAKLRALRFSIQKLAGAYGITIDDPITISRTPDWSSAIDDPHSFMLHATTQAMAAIIGGTDGLIVHPFYKVFGKNHSLAERMARNISTILKEESYLAKNIDPSAGSYYLESTTKDLTTNAIELLKTIEQKGGLSKLDVDLFIDSKTETP
ncbi:methylmalonyl-CoA mutase family protein [Roseivirga sp.]|uniref:methylmalonyl-CoA mutase family protein n=1 Tax=Roseivirga sp. TaxID=1964215 RepID=UPI003B8D6C8F